MKTILDLELNSSALIKELSVKDSTKRRLMDIGLTKNSRILMKGRAPLGDPILISFRGIDVALRKSDAAKIIID